MKNILIAASLALLPSYALAGPWTFESWDTGQIVVNSADQASTDETYFLTVECIPTRGWSVWIESPFDWDTEASYAAQVPAIFTIDGQTISDVGFIFDDRQWFEGIAAYPDGQQAAFDRLVNALVLASSSIGMTYFDRGASFSPEGSADAIKSVAKACE